MLVFNSTTVFILVSIFVASGFKVATGYRIYKLPKNISLHGIKFNIKSHIEDGVKVVPQNEADVRKTTVEAIEQSTVTNIPAEEELLKVSNAPKMDREVFVGREDEEVSNTGGRKITFDIGKASGNVSEVSKVDREVFVHRGDEEVPSTGGRNVTFNIGKASGGVSKIPKDVFEKHNGTSIKPLTGLPGVTVTVEKESATSHIYDDIEKTSKVTVTPKKPIKGGRRVTLKFEPNSVSKVVKKVLPKESEFNSYPAHLGKIDVNTENLLESLNRVAEKEDKSKKIDVNNESDKLDFVKKLDPLVHFEPQPKVKVVELRDPKDHEKQPKTCADSCGEVICALKLCDIYQHTKRIFLHIVLDLGKKKRTIPLF